LDFKQKSIVITGASAGIGEHLALELARQGAHLTLGARTRERLDRTAHLCEQAGGRAVAIPTDVGDPDACRRLIDEAVDAFGGIDVLVNNAGISMWGRFDELEDLSIAERIMRVNYLGSVYCTHFALPHLKARRGLLVAISSLSGKTGDVLVVSPGFVATEIRSRALGPSGKAIGESPRDEAHETMSVQECVGQILRAMERRRRELVMTNRARMGLWLKLVTPGLVDRIAARAVRGRRP
jgi:short-subunit dehydrogenase